MPVCSKGHAMGAFDVEDEDIVCDFCGDAINVAGFACIPCDYDVCRACGNKWWATGDRRGKATLQLSWPTAPPPAVSLTNPPPWFPTRVICVRRVCRERAWMWSW